MAKYLDPKSDIVFKKVFGGHPHLLKSFLNALLPLPEDGQIVSLQYLPHEQTPEIPVLRRTIVDVKCKDQKGQVFIVEMQIEWTDGFKERLLFGAAQAYVKQLSPGNDFILLNPVYGLGLINSIFDNDSPEWYHHYGLVKLKNHEEHIIKGLTLVFLELPKFVPTSLPEKRLQVLWLRFMRELNKDAREVSPDLLEVPEIQEAIRLTEESAYTLAELEAYESYWKQISSEKTLIRESQEKGIEIGKAQGIEITTARLAKAFKDKGAQLSLISEVTGLSIEDINKL